MALFLGFDLKLSSPSVILESRRTLSFSMAQSSFPLTANRSAIYRNSFWQRVDSDLGARPVLLGVALPLRSGI